MSMLVSFCPLLTGLPDVLKYGIQGIPKPLSKADADKIMVAVGSVEPLIFDCADVLIAKRDTFRGIPMAGDLINLVAQYHLMNLKASGSKLADGCFAAASVRQFVIHPHIFRELIHWFQDDHVDRIKSLKERSDAAIDRALAAYS